MVDLVSRILSVDNTYTRCSGGSRRRCGFALVFFFAFTCLLLSPPSCILSSLFTFALLFSLPLSLRLCLRSGNLQPLLLPLLLQLLRLLLPLSRFLLHSGGLCLGLLRLLLPAGHVLLVLFPLLRCAFLLSSAPSLFLLLQLCTSSRCIRSQPFPLRLGLMLLVLLLLHAALLRLALLLVPRELVRARRCVALLLGFSGSQLRVHGRLLLLLLLLLIVPELLLRLPLGAQPQQLPLFSFERLPTHPGCTLLGAALILHGQSSSRLRIDFFLAQQSGLRFLMVRVPAACRMRMLQSLS
mmetsp:Transcript_44429/g.84983  ORF Transcript_44429/g.84983 Transcript_44429/m.84983 type:complete len:297 (-) Transcript_44429:1726-2616(-)